MRLYKYLPPARIDVLESLQIRFSPPVSTNDRFELKPVVKGWASREIAMAKIVPRFRDFFSKADTPEKMLQVSIENHPEAESVFRESMRRLGPEVWFQLMKNLTERNFENAAASVHEFVEHNWATISEKFLQTLGTQVGILSLSQDARNPAMWGNYSDSSRGFVIGFDAAHPWFNQKRSEDDDFCHVRRVSYVSDNPTKYFSDLTAQDALYSKLEAWSYEKEWRMIFPLKDGIDTNTLDSFGQPIVLFPVPEDCLVEVIIGSRAAAETARRIQEVCEKPSRRVSVSRGST